MRVKSILAVLSAAGAAAVLYGLFRPAAVAVETAAVETGPMQVTVEAQGETRSHDRFVVAAPVGGRLLRTLFHDGDAVRKGDIVATLAPLPLRLRERGEARARVDAAESAERAAQAVQGHALADLAQAKRESVRLEQLFARGLVARQALEQAQNAADTAGKDAEAARSRAEAAAAALREARAALEDGGVPGPPALQLRAPGSGRILRIVEASERVLSPGAPIMVIGDLDHLEVVLEMLSADATIIAPGMPALLESGAGDVPLRAQVRLVEPYAFTKVSALGVEEKRTNVVLQFVDAPGRLGDGYRVVGRVVTWQGQAVLKAPTSALFRCGDAWCVYVVEGNRALRRQVQAGHMNDSVAEIVAGLRAGERVVRHPPNDLGDGSRVEPLER